MYHTSVSYMCVIYNTYTYLSSICIIHIYISPVSLCLSRSLALSLSRCLALSRSMQLSLALSCSRSLFVSLSQGNLAIDHLYFWRDPEPCHDYN